MLSSIYIMKWVWQANCEIRWCPLSVGLIITRSHPNMKAYMGELSPVVVVPHFLSLCLCIEACVILHCVRQCKSKITFPFKTRERQPWERCSYLSYSPCCLNLDFTHHPHAGRVHLAIRSSFNCARTTFKMPFHCLVSFGSIDLRIIVESGGFLSPWSS